MRRLLTFLRCNRSKCFKKASEPAPGLVFDPINYEPFKTVL